MAALFYTIDTILLFSVLRMYLRSCCINLFLLSAFALLFTVTLVSAQDTPEVSDPMPMDHGNMDHSKMSPEEMRSMMQEIKPAQDAPREASPNRVSLERGVQERIANLGENALNRLRALTARFQNITSRLESRTEKMKAQGTDVQAAEASLAEAKKYIEEANSALQNIPPLQSIVSSAQPRVAVTTMRTEIIRIRDLLRQAHSKLTETVQLLRTTPPTPQNTESTDTATSQTITQ